MLHVYDILQVYIILKKYKLDFLDLFSIFFLFQISLGVEYGTLQAYNPDFELQFSHKISQMIRFSQADVDASTFLYILKDDAEKLLYCYMYQAQSPKDVSIKFFLVF